MSLCLVQVVVITTVRDGFWVVGPPNSSVYPQTGTEMSGQAIGGENAQIPVKVTSKRSRKLTLNASVASPKSQRVKNIWILPALRGACGDAKDFRNLCPGALGHAIWAQSRVRDLL